MSMASDVMKLIFAVLDVSFNGMYVYKCKSVGVTKQCAKNSQRPYSRQVTHSRPTHAGHMQHTMERLLWWEPP